MSKTIDEKVVSMKFDNAQFERNVSTSMSTLDKLKKSLDLKGASKGLEEVDSAARKVNFNPLSEGVETVKLKFSALEVMAVTALANITNSALNAGKQIVKALTVDPIKTGLQEYETKINAIQVIQANTRGKNTMDDITAALDDLNTYADKTIYNFAQMTNNIGKFTAQGLDVQQAADAVKGMANLAAASGATAEDMSRATYQMSQALGGTIRKIDWNSLRNANMATTTLKDTLIDVAKVVGKIDVQKMMDDEGKAFEDTLESGWLSGELFTEAMNIYSGIYSEAELKAKGFTDSQIKNFMDIAKTAESAATEVKTFTQLWDVLKETAQSGWTQSWEYIIGDFETAKKDLTALQVYFSDLINASSDARNKVLKTWSDLGGRDHLIGALKNLWNGLLSVITPVKEAFREVFPPITAKRLFELTVGLRKLTNNFKLSDEQSAKLKSTFKGLFSFLDLVRMGIVKVVGGTAKLIGKLSGLGNGILDITGSFGDWISNLRDSAKETNIFSKAITSMSNFLQNGINKIKEFISFVNQKIEMKGFEGIADIVDRIKGIIDGLLQKVKETIPVIGDAFGSVFSHGDLKTLIDILNAGLLTSFFISAKNFFGSFGKDIKKTSLDFKGFLGTILSIPKNITEVLSSLRGCLEEYQNKLKAETLKSIAVAVGILAASIVVLSFIDPEKLSSAIGAITMLFGELVGSMALFNKIDGKFSGATKAVTVMIGMSIAVLILSAALNSLSNLSWSDLGRSLTALTVILGELLGVSVIMSKTKSKMVKGSVGIILLATAIKILASVCKDFGSMSWEEIGKGLTGVTALLLELVGVSILMSKTQSKMVKGSVGIILLAASMKILASVCKDFGAMSWGEIGKGLASIGGLLLEIAVFSKLTDKKKMMSTGTSLVIIAASMKIFASAISDFSSMSWSEIGKGLAAMAGALAEVAIAVNLMPKNMIGIGVGLVIVAASLEILADVVTKMSGLSWEEIGKGMTALGGAMLILAIGLNAMKRTLPGSAALLVASIALSILTPTLMALSSLSWGGIAKGLIMLAGAFVIIGVAGYALGGLLPVILGLSAAFVLFGVGCLTIGAGLVLIGAGIASLVAAISGGAVLIVEALKTIIVGIFEMVPMIVSIIGESLILLCDVIIEAAPKIGEVVKTLLTTIIGVMVECAPVFVEGLLKTFTNVLTLLGEYNPQLVDGLFNFIIGILEGIANNIPDLITAVVDILMAVFIGAIEALKNVDPQTLVNGLLAVAMIDAIVVSLAAMAALTPLAMVGVLGFGAIITELSVILAAIGALSQIPGLQWLINESGDFLQSIGNAIGGFIGGIVGGIAEGITSSLPQIGTDLSTFMTNLQPFLDGASSIDESMVNSVNSLIGMVLVLTAANLIESIASFVTGKSSIEEFANQIVPFGEAIAEFSDSVSDIDGSDVTAAANAGKALAEMAKTLPNSGGVAGFFAGDNDMDTFGDQLTAFGEAMSSYSESISGIDTGLVKRSATAGTALAEMAETLPNTGGVSGFFAGDNDMDEFGEQLTAFGDAMKAYSESVAGINPNLIKQSALAGTALGEMAETLPNAGGVVSWFTGENNMETFGSQLVVFGGKLKEYSDAVTGIKPEVIGASSYAGKALASMAESLPNDGGIVSWFTGENDMGTFGTQLVKFGKGLKSYYLTINGIKPDVIGASATAGKALMELASTVPNSGGVVSWFAGDNEMDTFGDQLSAFGDAMKAYSESVAGIDSEVIVNSVTAGQALVELASTLPNTGGLVNWFNGDKDIGTFKNDLVEFGKGLKLYYLSITGIKPEVIGASIYAGKALVELANTIPNTGGVVSWINGDNDMATFGAQLVKFGGAMRSYSLSIAGIDPETITASATAGQALVELANTLPNTGGIVSWFNGDKDLATFGEQLVIFGGCMTEYSNAVSGINPELINKSVSGAKGLVDIAKAIPEDGWFDKVVSIEDFGAQIAKFGEKYAAFYNKVKDVKPVGGVISNVKQLVSIGKDLSGFESEGMKEFSKGLESLAETNIDGLVTAFEGSYGRVSAAVNGIFDIFNASVNNCKPKTLLMFRDVVNGSVKAINERGQSFLTAGSSLMSKLNAGFRSRSNIIRSTVSSMVSSACTSTSENRTAFVKAGASLVEGFAAGITENTFQAEAAAAAMAEAAYEAAKEELEINSPSKKFRRMAGCVPEGFAQGIDRLGGMVKKSSIKMANLAIDSTADALGSLTKVVDSNTDFKPAIRPVVDMSNLRSTDLRLGSNMNTMITRPVDSWSQRLISAQSDINESNNKVITAINGLREDISTLYDSDNKELALYVDSKKLTSALVKPMNRQFNVIATREGGL